MRRTPTLRQIVRELRHWEKHSFEEMAGHAADLIEKQAAELKAIKQPQGAAIQRDGEENVDA